MNPAEAPRRASVLLLLLLLSFSGLAACHQRTSLDEIRQMQQAGNFAGTVEPLRELLRERRDDLEISYLYGRALSATGESASAEWSLRNAMKDPAWLEPAGMQLALNALRTRNYSVAIEVADQVIAAHPDSADALLVRANAYTRSNMDHEHALADTERVLELQPERVEALEPKILALLSLERIDEAGAALEELGERIDETDLGPDTRAWHCATMAIFANDGDDIDLARERWTKCLEEYPAHSNVVGGAVQFFDAQREFGRSLEILREAQRQAPANRSYRTGLAERLRGMGRAAEAEALLREATESELPQVAATAWFDLAKHHQDVGENERAAEAIERALELTEKGGGEPQPQLLLEHADSLLMAGKLDRALAIADRMTVAAHRELIRARVAQKRGDPAEALVHFEDAFRLWPNNPWARYYGALAAEAVGDFDRAIEAYRYSIRISAGATDARSRIARLHLAEGRPAEAIAMLRVSEKEAPIDTLLAIRLWAQLGRAPVLSERLEKIREENPAALGTALARAAVGVRARVGPAAAVAMLRQAEEEGLQLRDPRHADALRMLVRLSHDAGSLAAAEPDVRAAVAAHPNAPPFQEILGLWLELAGAPPDEARAAYQRALNRDPDNAGALAGLARLSVASDPDQALALFDRAAAADRDDAEPLHAAITALLQRDRKEEARVRLESLLEEFPYDAEAAMALVRLQLERDEPPPDRTLERANRAVRFRGGIAALELLREVHERRGESEEALEAAERAQALRDRLRGDTKQDEAEPTPEVEG